MEILRFKKDEFNLEGFVKVFCRFTRSVEIPEKSLSNCFEARPALVTLEMY